MIKKNYLKLPIKKLKNYKFNNKIHTEADIDEIVKSIQKCEYLSPIVIDEKFEIIN
jgi:ParB-like chromosome segregation protein Spo0J